MTLFSRTPCDEGVIRGRDRADPCPKRVGRWVVTAAVLGSALAFIDGTVVNIALPAIQRELGAPIDQAQWIVEAYLLTLSALILVGGMLGDRYGRNRVMIAGVAIFGVASIACGAAPDAASLIVARALQGVGAALLVPSSLAIISANFEGAERGKAIGTWSGFSALTTAAGPVLGGLLIDWVSWRWIFFANLPGVVLVIWILWTRVPETRDPKPRPIDILGAALAIAGLGGLTFGLIEAGRLGLTHPFVLVGVCAGTVFLLLFVVAQRRRPNAMMPPQLFAARAFSVANLLTFLLYAALGGALFFLPFNLIQIQGYSATETGAALLPFVVLMFTLSRVMGGLTERLGARTMLAVGPTVAAAGFLLLAVPGTASSYWTGFFPAIAVLGLGLTISVAPLTTVVMGAVPGEQSGIASAINNTVSRVAGLIAVAALGLVVLWVFQADLIDAAMRLGASPDVRAHLAAHARDLGGLTIPSGLTDAMSRGLDAAIQDAFVAGFRIAMYVAAGLAFIAGIAGLALPGAGQRERMLVDDGAATVPSS